MKFHPMFSGHFAMGLKDLGPDAPGIIATQSTHKQLASFSQASQIHIKDRHIKGQTRRIEHRRFNETFLVHASTSPFYPLVRLARRRRANDEGQVRRGAVGRHHPPRHRNPQKIRALGREFKEKARAPEQAWFFDPFVPDVVETPRGRMAWEEVPTDDLAENPAYWTFQPGAAWHGFRHIAPHYALTDPCKLTLITPGFDRATGGKYLDHGVPAPVVAQYLRENRIVAEKNDLNSLLFLLTPGVESSKAGSLISALVAFKNYHDENAPLEEVIPEFVAKPPQALRRDAAARPLCQQMHAFYRDAGTSDLQRRQFRPEHLPRPAMRRRRRLRKLTRNQVRYLPLDQMEGKIATTLWVVYPPGIATIAQGEILDERAKPMLDYLKTFERGANLFPGFEAEIQGIYREIADGRLNPIPYLCG